MAKPTTKPPTAVDALRDVQKAFKGSLDVWKIYPPGNAYVRGEFDQMKLCHDYVKSYRRQLKARHAE